MTEFHINHTPDLKIILALLGAYISDTNPTAERRRIHPSPFLLLPVGFEKRNDLYISLFQEDFDTIQI